MRSGSDPVSNANLCNPTRAAAAAAAVCVARVESVLCLCVRAREEKEERGRKRGSRNCGAAEKVSFAAAADIELQPSRPAQCCNHSRTGVHRKLGLFNN